MKPHCFLFLGVAICVAGCNSQVPSSSSRVPSEMEIYNHYYAPRDAHEVILTWHMAVEGAGQEKIAFVFRGKEMGGGQEGLSRIATEITNTPELHRVKIVAPFPSNDTGVFMPAEENPINIADSIEKTLIPIADKLQIELVRVYPFLGDGSTHSRLPKSN